MLHAIFEISPFIAGILCGLLIFFRGRDRLIHPRLVAAGSVGIGFVCALIAGELSQGLLIAISSVVVDSSACALGWIVAHVAVKRIAA
jgi:hypothetical protein